jgi:hypothetical protein
MGLYLILRQTPSHPVHTIGGAIGEWWVRMCSFRWACLTCATQVLQRDSLSNLTLRRDRRCHWLVSGIFNGGCDKTPTTALSIARVTLKWAETNGLVDADNFLAYGVGLTFFTLGTVGMAGSDDIFAAFCVGNSFVSELCPAS